VVVAFHIINARAFSIGVFPWLAISATTLFFSPSWPRRIIGVFRPSRASPPGNDWEVPSERKQLTVLSFVAVYLAIQLLVPLRHLLSRGGVEWSSVDHRFSWRMMLVNRHALSYFYVTDPNSGRTVQVSPQKFLNLRQTVMMAYQPDLTLQFAHYLAKVMPRKGPKPLKVEARMFVSINGRKPELFIDPNVDLAAEPRSLKRPRWLLPIHEPLPPYQKDSSENLLPPQFDGN
jgi:hypothetical protein